jgi:two-component system, chemotaxis family, sensor kinase CheA
MTVMDDETLKMYVDESREHLANIETDLLAIEERGADIDDELVNKVFRAAHSLKGGAGFLNLIRIKELAHKMENVLDMIRARELVPNPEVINILLMSFDCLRGMINGVETSNDVDISEFVISLTGLTTANLPEEHKKSISNRVDIALADGRVVMQIPEFDLNHARNGGQYIYLVVYDMLNDVQRLGRTPLEILKNMMDAGVIVESLVDMGALGTLDDEPSRLFPFYILYGTILEPPIMAGFLQLDQSAIRQISEGRRPVKPVLPPETAVTETPMAPESGLLSEPEKEILPVKEKTKPERKTDPAVPAGMPQETSLRVNVQLLESLMNLAGELVLGRNQLHQAIAQNEARAVKLAGQRISIVTSELQEAIMLTRMQSIGNIFNKFPRVVRDLAKNLGKEVILNIDGKDVEMDKTIIEGLSDPLTHLVRNSVDHGVETPEIRIKAGKKPAGIVHLRAYHGAGQVNIEISDDGKGIDPQKIVAAAISRGLVTQEQARIMSDKEKMAIILLPGFSTAEKVTDVSGRGVGMDVVKTNMDRLGGQVEIESEIGKGSTFRIKLPLTLAIIPCLFVSVGGERFAIPQANVLELIRIRAAQVKEKIELVGDAEVLILRGKMIPILNLANGLGMSRTYPEPPDGERKQDRRSQLANRRSRASVLFPARQSGGVEEAGENVSPALKGTGDEKSMPREGDRRFHAASDLNIVIVTIGAFEYGLVVEELHDSIEIVVKPLGRHLKALREYAGATIMGDGKVALILDVNGLAALSGLTSMAGTTRALELADEGRRDNFQDIQSFLLFRNTPEEQLAVPLDLVQRIEQIQAAEIEEIGGRKVMQYRGKSMPLFYVNDVVRSIHPLPNQKDYIVIVFSMSGKEVGLIGITPVDITEVKVSLDRTTLKQMGIMGSTIIGKQTTLILDIHELAETVFPELFTKRDLPVQGLDKTFAVLLAEDSEFFRNQVTKFIEGAGYQVFAAEDGQAAWELLQEKEREIDLVVTDIEMPRLDGFGLARNIRSDQRFARLPIIAVTSLAGEDDAARGKEVGIDDYQVKLDREKLLSSITAFRHRLKEAADHQTP